MEKLYGKQLEIMATKARLLGLDAVHTAASGHIGGSLSAMDILTTLYFNVMQVDPANPQDPDRDRFVLSKGHCTPALYPVLSLRGFFPQEDLKLFRSIKGHYSGHPDMRHVKGVDMSTGSLGQGISRRSWHGSGRKACKEGLPRLCPAGRRRDRRGPGLGGCHVRCQVSPR